MAWNEPGGGKRRDPWQGGGEQPDLDAMLKRFRDGFGRAFGPPGGGAWLVVLGILVLWFALDSWRTIDESNRGVVLRFGKYDRQMGAGLNFKWPRPIEEVIIVESARVRSTTDQVRMLTKDENLVIVDFNVQYSVSDPFKFLFSVKDPEQTLREAAESAVRQVIGAFAAPDVIHIASGLPKTRSGKIMRRILRKIASSEYEGLGDTSTLAEPEVVNRLIEEHQSSAS